MTQQHQLPVHLQNRQSKPVRQALQNLNRSSPPYLSIEGGRFTLVDAVGNELPVQTFDPQLGPYIDINVIDANEHVSKVFWGSDNTYNPNAQSYLPPVCFSDNGVGPSRNVTEPQAPTCAQCPNGVWGSATSRITGKGIKACVDIKKVAFTTAGHNTVFLLRIPPNSLKNMGLYEGGFSGQPIDISDIITRVSFVPGIQGTLQFQAVDYIDAATAALRENVLSTNAADGLIGRHDVVHPQAAQLSGGAPAALPPPQQAVQQPTPNPIQQAPVQQFAQQPVQQQLSAGNASPPFVMPRQGFAPGAAPQQTSPAAQQGPGAAPVPGSRPRGRPRNAQQAPVQQTVPQQAPFPTNGPVVQPGNNFGIVSGVAPNAELAAALASALINQ